MTESSTYLRAQHYHQLRQEGASWQDLAELSGWQISSLQSLVSRYKHGKLRKNRPPNYQAGRWSKGMDKLLLKHWGSKNSHQIALIINRAEKPDPPVTYLAVNARAHRKDLEKPGSSCEWKTENLGEIAWPT